MPAHISQVLASPDGHRRLRGILVGKDSPTRTEVARRVCQAFEFFDARCTAVVELPGGGGFAAAEPQLAARDAWIGWDPAARAAHMHQVITLSRFLVRPGLACTIWRRACSRCCCAR